MTLQIKLESLVTDWIDKNGEAIGFVAGLSLVISLFWRVNPTDISDWATWVWWSILLLMMLSFFWRVDIRQRDAKIKE